MRKALCPRSKELLLHNRSYYRRRDLLALVYLGLSPKRNKSFAKKLGHAFGPEADVSI